MIKLLNLILDKDFLINKIEILEEELLMDLISIIQSKEIIVKLIFFLIMKL